MSPYRNGRHEYVRLSLPSLDTSYPGEALNESAGIGGIGGIGNLRKQLQHDPAVDGLQLLDREVALRLQILSALTRRHFRLEAAVMAVPKNALEQDRVRTARAVIFSRKL